LLAAAPGAIVVPACVLSQPDRRRSERGAVARDRRIVKTRQLLPILDIAYQASAMASDADGAVVRLFAGSGAAFLVANSLSKSFSLYGERVAP